MESDAEPMKTAVITCVNENWLAPACVTLLSVSRNLGATKADLFIIVDKLSESGRRDVVEFETRHSVKINLAVHEPQGFAGLNPHRYSSATFLRLCLPEIISKKYHRILYLDSDVLALADVSSLLKIDLSGKTLGAVPEVKMAPGRGILTDRHRRKLGIASAADYFNAGVLLFDWQQTLSMRTLGKARTLLLSGRNFEFLDQDALNLVYENDWLALPLKWNVEQSAACYLNVKPALRHFNHVAKPWDWSHIMAYAAHHKYYVDALEGLALQRFLQKPKRGNPMLASIEYHFRNASLHQRHFLRKRYARLL